MHGFIYRTLWHPEGSGCCTCWMLDLWRTEASDKVCMACFADYQLSISPQSDCFLLLSSWRSGLEHLCIEVQDFLTAHHQHSHKPRGSCFHHSISHSISACRRVRLGGRNWSRWLTPTKSRMQQLVSSQRRLFEKTVTWAAVVLLTGPSWRTKRKKVLKVLVQPRWSQVVCVLN